MVRAIKKRRSTEKAASKKSTTKKSATKRSTTKKTATKRSGSKRASAKTSSKKTASKKRSTRKNKLGVKNSLVNNINAHKKKGDSKPKKNSTVDKKQYKKMEENWGKKD